MNIYIMYYYLKLGLIELFWAIAVVFAFGEFELTAIFIPFLVFIPATIIDSLLRLDAELCSDLTKN